MKILFIGDIAGAPGREAVKLSLPRIREQYNPDIIIANGENATHGHAISPEHYRELMDLGVSAFTGGNHSYMSKDHIRLLDEKDTKAIRPANYPASNPGRGWLIIDTGMLRVALINVQGRAFMKELVDCPFRTAERIIKEDLAAEHLDGIFIDYHAETTSEKKAFFYFCEQFERVVAIAGTHTHTQTNDAQIGPTGIGFVTDAGMCGAYRSVLGVTPEPIIKRMLTQMPQSHDHSDRGDGLQFNAVLFTIEQHRCTDIKLFNPVLTDY